MGGSGIGGGRRRGVAGPRAARGGRWAGGGGVGRWGAQKGAVENNSIIGDYLVALCGGPCL